MGLIKDWKYEIKYSVREKKWEVYNGANQRLKVWNKVECKRKEMGGIQWG